MTLCLNMFVNVCERKKRGCSYCCAHTFTHTHIKAEIGFRKCFIICSLPKLLITATLFHLCIPPFNPSDLFLSLSLSPPHFSLPPPPCVQGCLSVGEKSDGKGGKFREEGRKKECVHHCGGADLSLPVGFPFPFFEKRAFPLYSRSPFSVSSSLSLSLRD